MQPRWETVEEPLWTQNEYAGRTAGQLDSKIAKLAEAQPWGRQPGESARAYSAFRLYRELGPARSLAQVTQCCRVAQGATASLLDDTGNGSRVREASPVKSVRGAEGSLGLSAAGNGTLIRLRSMSVVYGRTWNGERRRQRKKSVRLWKRS